MVVLLRISPMIPPKIMKIFKFFFFFYENQRDNYKYSIFNILMEKLKKKILNYGLYSIK